MYMQTYMHAHTHKHAYMHAHLLRKLFEESNVQTFQRLGKQSDRAAQVHVSIADVHPENSFFRKMAYKPCLDFRFVSTQYFGLFCFVNKTYFDQTCIQPFKENFYRQHLRTNPCLEFQICSSCSVFLPARLSFVLKRIYRGFLKLKPFFWLPGRRL